MAIALAIAPSTVALEPSPPGSPRALYQIIVNSDVNYLPLQSNRATTAVVSGGTISGTTLSEFSASNLTTPISGASDPIAVTVKPVA
jgi:hypothetical protein